LPETVKSVRFRLEIRAAEVSTEVDSNSRLRKFGQIARLFIDAGHKCGKQILASRLVLAAKPKERLVAGFTPKLFRTTKGFVALSLLLVAPLVAEAAGIGFRNDLKIPIFVQGESVIDGMLRKGQPVLIIPGRVGWDLRLPPGNRRITILDATVPAGRTLHRETINFEGQDLRFLIRPGPAGTLKLILLP
jgi:hypothetical protein